MEQVLYSLPDGWHKKQLGDVVKLSQGTQVPVGDQYLDQEDGLIRFLRISDFVRSDEPPRYILNPGSQYLVEEDDICMIRYGDAGRAVTGLAGALANNLFKISPSESLLKRFLFLQLCSPRCVDYLRAANNSSTMPAISFKAVNAMEVNVAPLDEQKRIVEKLDALLTRIDTAIEHLQESVTLADALSKNGLSEIFESLKDSYEVVPLSSVVKINSGIALPKLFKNGFSDGDIPFFKVAQMNNHHENMVDPEIKFSEIVAKEHKVKLFPKGSTLIPKRGGAILTNKKRILLEDASYDSNIMGLKADESKISDDYLFAFMRTIDLANFVDASTIPQVNNKHIDQMQIPLASIEEQADVVSRVNLLVKKVEVMNYEIQRQLDDLQALKSSILDSAFKGEL
ncbi:restriction endonuclease subunit S [Pseudoalteromonas xiamenensis]|uniref:restriction endonuclease subunit S n=1 Tax=Pseudoalteromonas xiamenensis TaxID=882626 RepID=UPI0035F07642